MKQASPFGKSAVETSRYGRSDMGTRIDNEGTVPSARSSVQVILRTKFILRGGGGGGGGGENCNTPKYTLVVFNVFRVFCGHKLNFS